MQNTCTFTENIVKYIYLWKLFLGEIMEFYNRIKEICKKHKKVALFVDMDGTIVEYRVFPENFVTTET